MGGTLTEASLSEQIGREVRRQLYEWAVGAAESTHLAVAAVCSGQLARPYPQTALTRLRHLAVGQNTRLDENGAIVILSETGARDWDLLAGLWRGALRDHLPDGAAAAAGVVASGWLEAAVQD